MDIILYRRSGGEPRAVHCNGSLFVGLASLLVAVVVALAYQGGRLAGAVDGGSVVEGRVHEDHAEAEAARQRSLDELAALTTRLGRLQAEVVRLEALGQRLVEVAGLDGKEFDFRHEPPQGGPVADEATGRIPSAASLAEEIDRLARTLGDREGKLAALETLYRERRLHDQARPKGRPIRKGWISSYFGIRTDPFTGRKEMHKGLDLAGKMGSEVVAVADGVVTWSGKRYGYGNLVEINHGNGYVTRYGHNSRLLVEPGEVVRRGQVIALMGSTGRSTGPHVHFEVLAKGRQIDPAPFVRRGR